MSGIRDGAEEGGDSDLVCGAHHVLESRSTLASSARTRMRTSKIRVAASSPRAPPGLTGMVPNGYRHGHWLGRRRYSDGFRFARRYAIRIGRLSAHEPPSPPLFPPVSEARLPDPFVPTSHLGHASQAPHRACGEYVVGESCSNVCCANSQGTMWINAEMAPTPQTSIEMSTQVMESEAGTCTGVDRDVTTGLDTGIAAEDRFDAEKSIQAFAEHLMRARAAMDPQALLALYPTEFDD